MSRALSIGRGPECAALQTIVHLALGNALRDDLGDQRRRVLKDERRAARAREYDP